MNPGRLLLAFLAMLASQALSAHEVKPAYLEIREASANQFQVIWKMPIGGGIPAPLEARLPANCEELDPRSTREATRAILRTWQVHCHGGLAEKQVVIEGLQYSMTDALVRISLRGLPVQTARLTPRSNTLTISAAPSPLVVINTYFLLGVEHILLGIDHLLFVFALLLVVTGWRKLIGTITAFTIAHSLTLSAAALGLVRVPQAPVEAVIALSILFLATEIVRARRGHIGISYRKPWLVAFAFGLLHGLGFAGALAEIGLPSTDIPLALLLFNLGVEAGQLVFICCVVSLTAIVKGLSENYRDYARLAMSYTIGSVAMFWTIERVASFYV